MKKKFSLFLKILLTTLSVLLLVTTFPVRITADDESGIGSEVDQQEILEQEEDSAGSDVQDTDNVDEIVGGSSSDPVDFSYEDEQYVLPSDGFAQALQTGTSNAKSLPAGVAAIVTFSSGDKTFVYYFDSSNKTILLSDILIIVYIHIEKINIAKLF